MTRTPRPRTRSLFALREWAKSRSTRQKEGILLQTIRTMPPPEVLERFKGVYSAIHQYIAEQVDGETDASARRQAAERGMRLALNGLSVLAAVFQRSSKEARYAANFMVYRPIAEIRKLEQLPLNALMTEMKDFLDHQCLDDLDGALELNVELSGTNNSSTPFDQDGEIKRLVIPVPARRRSSHNDKTRCLPGASMAFDIGSYLIDDTRLILNDYDESQSYEVVRGIFEKIDKYFREDEAGKRVRSFFSIAVPQSDRTQSGTPLPIGVVNLHSDAVNLFADEWLFRSYRCLVSPILDQVAYLAQKRG